MDIFKFNNPAAPTLMQQGEIINGLTSKTWIERYRTAGEFTLKAPVGSDLKNILPLGTFISHVDTAEIMIVEDHVISETDQTAPEIVITGRGYETWLEQRMVGLEVGSFPRTGSDLTFVLDPGYTWAQAAELLNEHINSAYIHDGNNNLPYTTIVQAVTGSSPTVIARTIQKGSLYAALIDLLKVDNLGIKIVRPNTSMNPTSLNTFFIIHKGIDRRTSVSFSYDTGEIITADYLWSNKTLKNAALISGRYVQTTAILPGPLSLPTGYGRRWMFVDASEYDQGMPSPPVDPSPEFDAMVARMQQRGFDVLNSQLSVALTKAQVSKEGVKAVFRKDYDVGDLITVHGDYDTKGVMRVTEYAEIEDNTGASGYPTLSVDLTGG